MRFHKLTIEKREVVQLLRHLVDLLISRTSWNTGEDEGNNEFFGKDQPNEQCLDRTHQVKSLMTKLGLEGEITPLALQK